MFERADLKVEKFHADLGRIPVAVIGCISVYSISKTIGLAESLEVIAEKFPGGHFVSERVFSLLWSMAENQETRVWWRRIYVRLGILLHNRT